MPNLTERQQNLLDLIIADYIATAQPVGSEYLQEKHKLTIKPATVRRELHCLTETGWLLQPHTSAGRVPADKAYRFYVDRLLEKHLLQQLQHYNIFAQLDELTANPFEFLPRATKILAEQSSALAFSSLLEEPLAFTEGWARVFKEPEFQSPAFVREFSFAAEKLIRDITEYSANDETEPVKIKIGKECRLPKARQFSVLLVQGTLPGRKQESVFGLLGPKRMDYGQNINLLNILNHILND